ncbi:hypothetical protein [Paenibacillus oceani]|uniref:Uncharacterized protein n=1 Tax=Paenibacillus oceani TaxID=2772510 RepID=A0A927C3I9_9BACL|nr:hypothetical protein [Paenibacillus oceani]MBD2860653.1 hypothetical protein [Paenibacillus oceani]
MKKSAYKSAMFHVKTSEDFKEATYRKLMLEMEKETPKQKHENHQKERLLQMEKTTKRKFTGWAIGIAAFAVLAVGIFTMNPFTLYAYIETSCSLFREDGFGQFYPREAKR